MRRADDSRTKMASVEGLGDVRRRVLDDDLLALHLGAVTVLGTYFNNHQKC